MTPETDAAIIASNGQWSNVLKETCQRLERERDEAMEALSGRTVSCAACNHAAIERDEARKQLVRSNHFLHQAEENLESIYRERDEAREALENHMAATIHTCHDECKRPMCVLRRERDEAREELKQLKDQYGR